MPTRLPQRKAGWLLRSHYKNVMKKTRQKIRTQQGNPKFNPQNSTNYNFKRAIYRSTDMPKIAKLLESEVITGRISIEVAKDLIGTMLRTRSLGVQGRYGIEGVKKVANSPRKSVEESAKFEASIGITPVLDEITGNTIQLSRTKNGNITLLVSRPKK